MKVLRFLNKADLSMVKVCRVIVAIIMLIEALMLFSGAIARYAFNHSIMWIDELSSYLLVTLTLFGCYCALFENKLAAVTFVVEALPTKLNKFVRFLSELCALVLVIALAYFSAQLCATPMIQKTLTPILRWSKLYFYALLPLVSCMMAFHQVIRLLDILFEGKNPSSKG